MVTKKPKVSIYLPPDLKEALDKWAEEENRSLSNLTETIVRDAVLKRLGTSKPSSKNKEESIDELDACTILRLLASGKRPSDGDLLVVANESEIDIKQLWDLRDRLFPHKEKSSNGTT